MATRKFAKDLMIQITDDDAPEGFEIIEEGEWIQGCEYQYKEIIFIFEGKCYSLDESRSGSPFTDWDYDSEYWPEEVEVYEVEPVEIKKVEWRLVK